MIVEKIRLSKPLINDKKKLFNLFREILKSGFFVQVKYVTLFEKQFAEYLEVKHAVAVSSGTAALHIALLTIGIKPGDEIIIPAYTFPATANVVELTGAKPVLVDVNIDTYNIDTKALEKFISDKTRAIIPVHLFGNPACMEEIMKIARKYDLYVIEDSAGALGSTFRGKKCGTIGHIGCFSLHPRKIITTAEGGVITTNNDNFAEKFRLLRNHGIKKKGDRFDVVTPGFNYRMNEFEAAVGIVQIKKINKLLEQRRKIAKFYMNELKKNKYIKFQEVMDGCTNSWQAFVIRLIKAENTFSLLERFQKTPIEVSIGTYAIHLLEYYSKKYRLKPSDYPNAQNLYYNCLAIPFFNGLKKSSLTTVIKTLKEQLNEI
ncbi:MAG: DegT/DnrJ/EryC1/StrS family aminotransferase [Candidatus Omnitrophica bacterium]|nr:DegT/DnrJ/EryC1/StrS family aminotransferase [Candidatus Omnitrophota bacterium]